MTKDRRRVLWFFQFVSLQSWQKAGTCSDPIKGGSGEATFRSRSKSEPAIFFNFLPPVELRKNYLL
jgi:hypothetical protein